MRIGPYLWPNPTALAPMAGVTDRPFRQLCKRLGAGYAVSEMVSSRPELRNTRKSRLRSNHEGESKPIAVQILGADPRWMAEAAQYNVRLGAQIIDINMGCPAKKVCNKAAGSALLADEQLVADILTAVVTAVAVPVTLKIRTGIDPEHRNAITIARIAQESGIAALAVHGRTRSQMYRGEAEYETIRQVAAAVDLPVIANGDIDTAEKARQVLEHTGAQGIMVGRAAQGRPWIFREISHYLQCGNLPAPPSWTEIAEITFSHLRQLHGFYGDFAGVRIARKHISWYLTRLPGGSSIRRQLMQAETPAQQLNQLEAFFHSPERFAA